jgi:hypothetical protein
MDVLRGQPDYQNVSLLCFKDVGCRGGYDNVSKVQRDDSHADLAKVVKSNRATKTSPLPTEDLLMNPKVMKDTLMDLEAFSSKMVSTIPTKCFVSILENKEFPIVDNDTILKKGERVKEDARVTETRAGNLC